MRKASLLFLIIGLFLYLPSLFGPFIWDDEDFVYANDYVKNFQLDKFFTSSITEGRAKGSNYFRPVQEIAYSTTHAVIGFNPMAYHLLNILVHIGATCTIFSFFKILFKKLGNREKFDEVGSNLISLLISLFFLIHPVQTEAVSYISGLSDPLYVLFGFLSLIFFLLRNDRKNMIPLSLFFFILCLLSKETGLVFLPFIILLDYKKSLIYIATACAYLWYHFTFINNFDIHSAWGNNPYANYLYVRLLTFVQNLFLYVQLLIFPKDLFMERDYTINIQTNFLNPYLIFFLIINLPVIYYLLKSKNNLLIFCYLAFFISFIPYTGIVLINGIFYEHFLYLPIVFFFAFWLILFQKYLKNKYVLYSLFAVLTLLGLRNLARQLDWTDSARFYSQTLEHAPKSVRIINGLGMAQADKGELDKAIQTYSLILKANPKVPNAYHNMANAYAAKGDIKNAEKFYQKALEVDPSFLFSVQSLINLYQQTDQQEKLKILLKKYKN